MTKLDSEEAARMKPKKDLTDALIAAMVKRHEAYVWTKDADFLKFLPKDSVPWSAEDAQRFLLHLYDANGWNMNDKRHDLDFAAILEEWRII